MLLAILCFGLFSYPFTEGLIIIIALILMANIVNTISYITKYSFRPTSYLRYGVLVFVFFFLFISTKEFLSLKQIDTLLRESKKSPSIVTSESLKNHYKRLSNNSDFVLCYGKSLYDNELFTDALQVLQQASRLKPSSDLICDLGRCYQYAKNYDEAERNYTLATYMVPSHITPRYHLFNLYLETGDKEKAIKKAKSILTMPVKIVNTTVIRVRNRAKIYLEENGYSKVEIDAIRKEVTMRE